MCSRTGARYFVAPSVKPGDSISWSELHKTEQVVVFEDGEPYFPGSSLCHQRRVTYQGVPFTPIPYCSFGDYDNSTALERSNVRTMRAEFPWLVHVTGSHGSEMLGYLGRRETQNPALIEAIDGLEEYPIHDESDESELESEMESEAWNEFGCRDFASFLTESVKGVPNYGIPVGVPLVVLGLASEGVELQHDLTYAGQRESETSARSTLSTAWFVVMAEHGSGETSHIESGGSVHFDFDDWYRTIHGAIAKRTERRQALADVLRSDESARSLYRAWKFGRDTDARDVLLDRLEEIGATAAVAHVKYYLRDSLGEVLRALCTLAVEWEVE